MDFDHFDEENIKMPSISLQLPMGRERLSLFIQDDSDAESDSISCQSLDGTEEVGEPGDPHLEGEMAPVVVNQYVDYGPLLAVPITFLDDDEQDVGAEEQKELESTAQTSSDELFAMALSDKPPRQKSSTFSIALVKGSSKNLKVDVTAFSQVDFDDQKAPETCNHSGDGASTNFESNQMSQIEPKQKEVPSPGLKHPELDAGIKFNHDIS